MLRRNYTIVGAGKPLGNVFSGWLTQTQWLVSNETTLRPNNGLIPYGLGFGFHLDYKLKADLNW